MQERKFDLLIARLCYGGNGNSTSEVADVGRYLFTLGMELGNPANYPQLGRIAERTWNDTPAYMVRNDICHFALQHGYDFVLMIDSDMVPDINLGKKPGAVPFFSSSLQFMLDRWDQGPCCIAAPYCGPEPSPHTPGAESCVYVFEWAANGADPVVSRTKLEMISRHQASRMRGIQHAAALPTGLFLMDTRVLTQGSRDDPDVPLLPRPWFDYEHDPLKREKASTEDVYFTRNCSMLGFPQFCNWDAWAGHAKFSVIGEPMTITADMVSKDYGEALLRRWKSDDEIRELNPGLDNRRLAELLGVSEADLTVRGNGHSEPEIEVPESAL